MMDCSFMPSGKWFVFCTTTGKTLKAGLASKAAAILWMSKPREPAQQQQQPPAQAA